MWALNVEIAANRKVDGTADEDQEALERTADSREDSRHGYCMPQREKWEGGRQGGEGVQWGGREENK